MSRQTKWLGGLLFLAGSSLLSAGTFTVSPLTADHTQPPGAVVTDRLLVVNEAEETAFFSVTAQDFTTDSAGVDDWRPLGSHSRSLADWITFAPSSLVLPPGGQGFIDYEIRVPGPEEVPEGSYWAAIQVQADRERRSLEEKGESRNGSRFGLKVAFVYAVKVYLNIAGTERPSLNAVGLQPGDEPGSLLASFTNTGNVILRPKVWLEIRDLKGTVLARMDSLKWTLQSGPVRSGDGTVTSPGHDYVFSLRDLPEPLPDGRYVVSVIADDGGPRLLGLTAPLNLSAPDEP